MPDEPPVVLLHQAAHEADRIRAALDDELPDLDLVVAEDEAESRDLLRDAEVALTFDMEPEQVAVADDLRWVQAMNAGVDSYPVDELDERGIALTNSAGIHGEQIGQQVLGYLLLFERRIHEGIRQQHAGEWEAYEGGELFDDTVGVVGLGAIGTRVAEYATQFDATVIGTKRDPATAPDAVDECYPADELDAVLERADYLVLACPLTEETEGLIGANELARLGDDGVLVNVARGEVVDQDALVDALERDEIRGAALDVTDPEPLPEDSPLRDMWNVVVTPHMAGSTPVYFERAMAVFADNYRAYVAGEELSNRIV